MGPNGFSRGKICVGVGVLPSLSKRVSAAEFWVLKKASERSETDSATPNSTGGLSCIPGERKGTRAGLDTGI